MSYRRIGQQGPSVLPIGLGCMGLSWAYRESERNDDAGVRLIRRALDSGIAFLDTADIYGDGHNERLVGTALRGRRDEAVLATKVGLVVDDLPNKVMHRDGRPERIRRAIDDSLDRLGTDHVDLLYLHRVDPNVPVEDTWGAMADAVGQGKAMQLGLSEVSTSVATRAHAVHPVAAIQSELSLWTRTPLAPQPADDTLRATTGGATAANATDTDGIGIVEWCREHEGAFVPFAPLGRGFLTGSIRAASFEDSDFRAANPRFAPPAFAANLAIVDGISRVAARLRATPSQVALAWLLAQGPHVIPIPGTKKDHYLFENAAAVDLVLTDADLAELAALPDPVGARY
jgi:aryl-alcohol dehydrogenase-like predicted oxidoreductase